ncbi:hypothetical protein J15TS10_16900 [Paenibacillus woosongensis]|uniref:KTSC domain-containing protein n=1 Tax=Paenibacillus woosongensis TaxID=307580 RepID=A0ABQ4MPD5_9BACL|nr:hypothetical protein J15TS10_16900 [Paenibacillus woosongensis]
MVVVQTNQRREGVFTIKVHSVLSGVIKGVGFEAGTLRVVMKSGKAYDYLGVSPEDHALFMQNFGKALNVIKAKYECVPLGDIYFPE